MRKTLSLLLIFSLLLMFCACSARTESDSAAADSLRDAILAAESGETTVGLNVDTHYFLTEEETYGYRLLGSDTPLPADKSGLREAIDLIRLWCDPEASLPEDATPAYQYVGIVTPDGETDCCGLAFGIWEEDAFQWRSEYAVDPGCTRLYELNVNTLEYMLLYAAKD